MVRGRWNIPFAAQWGIIRPHPEASPGNRCTICYPLLGTTSKFSFDLASVFAEKSHYSKTESNHRYFAKSNVRLHCKPGFKCRTKPRARRNVRYGLLGIAAGIQFAQPNSPLLPAV